MHRCLFTLLSDSSECLTYICRRTSSDKFHCGRQTSHFFFFCSDHINQFGSGSDNTSPSRCICTFTCSHLQPTYRVALTPQFRAVANKYICCCKAHVCSNIDTSSGRPLRLCSDCPANLILQPQFSIARDTVKPPPTPSASAGSISVESCGAKGRVRPTYLSAL